MSDLIFESLSIKNFGSFSGTTTLDLSEPGKFIYVTGENLEEPDLGANGIGKSTIWEALLWCLYGRTIRTARPGGSVEPWGSKKTTSVSILLQHVEPFIVERTRRPNNLTLNGEIVEQASINKAVGMSFEAFSNSVIMGQFNKLFLDLLPEQQTALFTELLSLDLWVEAADRASKRAGTYKKMVGVCLENRFRLEGKLDGIFKHNEDIVTKAMAWAEEQHNKVMIIKQSADAAKSILSDLKEPEYDTEAHYQAQQAFDKHEQKLQTLYTKRGTLSLEVNKLATQIDVIYRREYEPLLSKSPTCPLCGTKMDEDHLKRKITKVKGHLNSLLDPHDTLTIKLQNVEESIKFEQLVKEQCATTVLSHDKNLKEFENWRDAVAKTKNILETEQRRINDLNEEKNPYWAIVESLKPEREKVEAEIQEAIGKQNEAEAAEKLMEYWVKSFKEIRLNLLDDSLLELSVAATRNADALGLHGWAVNFATERETAKGDLVAKFTVTILRPDLNTIPWNTVSGGEGQRLRLAVSLGLSEILLTRAGLQPNLEVLDEPTAWLSQNGIEDLTAFLYDRSRELNRSVYLVDHRSLNQAAFDKVIWLEKGAAGSVIKSL